MAQHEQTLWDRFRSAMPVVDRWAYFDHAAVAPLPATVHDAVCEWAADVARDGGVCWKRWRNRVEDCRRKAATLIAAEEGEVALIHSTTEGVSLVAEGYPFSPGDNVVVPAGEFPSNLYPWLNLADRGVEVRTVKAENERLDLNRLDEACDERTRIVAASWVGFATGWRNDPAELAEIAHRHGALLFLDAIQGLGAFPIDVHATGVDFLAADGHKWMLGPEGAGILYVNQRHLTRLRPLGVGWNSVRHAGDYANPQLDLKPTAARYEGGTYDMVGIAGLAASLELLLDFGIDQIAKRVLELTDELCRRLNEAGATIASDRSADRASGIVAFEWPHVDALTAVRRLQRENVVVRARAGRLRASPHAYNNAVDIDRLLIALGDLDD